MVRASKFLWLLNQTSSFLNVGFSFVGADYCCLFGLLGIRFSSSILPKFYVKLVYRDAINEKGHFFVLYSSP